jgi:hypothetical protein
MLKETGYCDRCGADAQLELWLTLDGAQLCRSGALDSMLSSGKTVIGARRPGARDDGR